MGASPLESNQSDIRGKSVSGMAARTWLACVQEFVTFFRRNWTSARQNQIEASTVENIGSLKWWTNCGEAAGEVAGEEMSGLEDMMKARKSTNVTTATSSFKRLRVLSQTRSSGYLNLFNSSHTHTYIYIHIYILNQYKDGNEAGVINQLGNNTLQKGRAILYRLKNSLGFIPVETCNKGNHKYIYKIHNKNNN